MPVNWIYSSSCARQEIEGAVAVIIDPRSVMRADACHLPIPRDSATDTTDSATRSTTIRPGQSERSDARCLG